MKKTTQIFKALSDETRLSILALLQQGELCVCDLMAVLELPQSTVSRHLAYLKNAGLVEDRRQGRWMFYRLLAKPKKRRVLFLCTHNSCRLQMAEDVITLCGDAN